MPYQFTLPRFISRENRACNQLRIRLSQRIDSWCWCVSRHAKGRERKTIPEHQQQQCSLSNLQLEHNGAIRTSEALRRWKRCDGVGIAPPLAVLSFSGGPRSLWSLHHQHDEPCKGTGLARDLQAKVAAPVLKRGFAAIVEVGEKENPSFSEPRSGERAEGVRKKEKKKKEGGREDGDGIEEGKKKGKGTIRREEWSTLPKVMILGRPNVGKSALFNRLTRTRDALVFDTPTDHVTRDHQEGLAQLGDLQFCVVDTAGAEPWAEAETVLGRTLHLTSSVLDSCDIALLLLDARDGIVPRDMDVANWLRRCKPAGVHVVPVVNKSEGRRGDPHGALLTNVADAYALGLGEPVALSAATGEGLSDLYDRLRPLAKELATSKKKRDRQQGPQATERAREEEGSVGNNGGEQEMGGLEGDQGAEEEEGDDAADGVKHPLHLAIAGRPNVGKSTLVNQLLGKERVLTGPEPGLTRDAVQVQFEHEGRTVWLVDTAGWMRRSQVAEGAAALSAKDARYSVMHAQVVALVLDAEEIGKERLSMKSSEVALARWVVEEGRALVLVVNKVDQLAGPEQARLKEMVLRAVPEEIESTLRQVVGIPVLFLSALSGSGVQKLMPTVEQIYAKWCTRISTARLNRWLQKVLARHPRSGRSHGAKMRFITQVKARPPTFVVFVTGSGEIPDTDLRFIASSLREDFGLQGIPLRVLARHHVNKRP